MKESFLSAQSAASDLVFDGITGATRTVAEHLELIADEAWREQQ